jgi:hypothetical protein
MPIRSHGPSFGLSRWAAAAAISGALAGCYTPVALPPGAPCKTTEGCPADQQCLAGLCAEAAVLTVDAGASGPGSVGNAPGDAGPGDASAAMTCQSSDACTTAITLGKVSGDTGNQMLTAQGSRAAWFRIRVTEDGTSLDGAPLRVLARLTPPAGEDFDVRLYVNPGTDAVECARTTGTATTSGTAKEIRASWGDNAVFDDNDDSRNVSIEVRPLSGSCSPTANWQLVIEGNGN